MFVPDKWATISRRIETRFTDGQAQGILERIIGRHRVERALREETRRCIETTEIAGMLAVSHLHWKIGLRATSD